MRKKRVNASRIFGIMLILLFCSLNKTAAKNDEPQMTFSVLSDIHIVDFDKRSHHLFLEALKDHREINPQSSLLVLNGDLTDGYRGDYERLNKLLGQVSHPAVHATMGNHEYYQVWDRYHLGHKLNPDWISGQAKELFLSYFKYGEVYHDFWLGGHHFIFLSGERYRDEDPAVREDAYLSQRQLRWLSERLNDEPASSAEPKRPAFVFVHQPLKHSLDGSALERGIVQHEQLRHILSNKHRLIILFTGHTHEDVEETKQFRYDQFYMVGSGSVRQAVKNQSPCNKSESLVVEVYDNRIVIKKREHLQKRWILPHDVIGLK
jgi:predicted phosphodiesterase